MSINGSFAVFGNNQSGREIYRSILPASMRFFETERQALGFAALQSGETTVIDSLSRPAYPGLTFLSLLAKVRPYTALSCRKDMGYKIDTNTASRILGGSHLEPARAEENLLYDPVLGSMNCCVQIKSEYDKFWRYTILLCLFIIIVIAVFAMIKKLRALPAPAQSCILPPGQHPKEIIISTSQTPGYVSPSPSYTSSANTAHKLTLDWL